MKNKIFDIPVYLVGYTLGLATEAVRQILNIHGGITGVAYGFGSGIVLALIMCIFVFIRRSIQKKGKE